MTTPKKPPNKATQRLAEFITYSIIALILLALVVGGFFAHLALIRWGLRIWPI
ncbi:hypothetical protein [Sporosarcina koreensis]|uniref:hypothetical protein n=1 Tax=Sporosarcina koreensis TaxID=334735 RepID=UPI000ACC40D7|nr:hypothetical protein [Sporosarcina koreensis]